MAGRTCYKCGDPYHFASVCDEYKEAKSRGVPFVPPPQKAQERRERLEREAREEATRREEKARREAKQKRLEELAEKRTYEDERDERLMRMVREELLRNKEKDDEGIIVRKVKKVVRTNEQGETLEEEKERLRRMIAMAEMDEEDFEDDELRRLHGRADGLILNDKRKRGKEMVVGNSPPMVTPTKGQRTGLSSGVKLRIAEIRGNETTAAGCSSPVLETVGKIALSIKHVTVGTGPGAREEYEANCRELFEALTIDKLKDVCKAERIVYGKRETVINRLVKGGS
ncbi:hypothetical protein CBR_g40719 [Chara braunii]|uniref:CCHC-type domain-containing protein n=1 Tax=Chara braunii TaxID=69332 RepID=A0A388LUB2_CHABU|nr:hypothetical protein CBR_g40719 [Chara braunii]|eukprot:GBG85907.1 hypothetical protein CBR_g40719 [Chara braunii]